MPIEIIPRKIEEFPLWQKVLFYVSIGFLIIVILTSLIFNNSLKTSQKKLRKINQEISQIRTTDMLSLEKEILFAQTQIRDFSYLLNDHSFPNIFFQFLEKICHPQVWFSKFSLNSKDNRATVSGTTDNFTSLGQQLMIMKGNSFVREVNLSKISLKKIGKIGFTFDLSFNPGLLK